MIKILIIIAILIIISIIVLIIQNRTLDITKYEIINNKIPKEFNDFKIIQISDYHNIKSKKINEDLINEIIKEKPDIITITGDFIDSRKTNIEIPINLIKQIKQVAPIYYVPGNHESRIKEYINYKKLKNEMEKLKVHILESSFDTIKKGEQRITVLGLLDPCFLTRFESKHKMKLNEEISAIDFNKENYTILLSHRPEHIDIYAKNKIDLALTGHAHGGQFRIPFIGGIIAPNQGFFPKYTSGTFNKQKTTMIVSRGIGNSVIPVRVNNNPELVVITLKNI